MPLNMPPRYAPMQYSAPMPRPGMMPPSSRDPGPPAMSMAPGQQQMMMGRPPISVNPPNMPVPPPPGSQFTPSGIGRPYPPMPMPPPPNMPMGSVRISVSVPNVDEGNLKGRTLEMTVQSLAETIGILKEKIAGEVQLPANKQKLSGSAGFLKDNLALAYYNIAPGETLTLALRERGGRKR